MPILPPQLQAWQRLKMEKQKKNKKKTQPTLCKALLQRVLRSRPVSDLSLPFTVCGENIQQVASSGRAHSQQFLSQEGLGSLYSFHFFFFFFYMPPLCFVIEADEADAILTETQRRFLL